MDRSTLEKLILAKLPLPADCIQAIKQFLPLNPPTPTAALISQLKFSRCKGTEMIIIKGSGVRAAVKYGRIGHSEEFSEYFEESLGFCFDSETGEPAPAYTETPTPWLQIWRDDVRGTTWEDRWIGWHLDEESRNRLNELWD